jgi:hypothetical protein
MFWLHQTNNRRNEEIHKAQFNALSNLRLNYVNLWPHCNYTIARASLPRMKTIKNGDKYVKTLTKFSKAFKFDKRDTQANLSVLHVFKLSYLQPLKTKLGVGVCAKCNFDAPLGRFIVHADATWSFDGARRMKTNAAPIKVTLLC